jgi:hypothetical protein
MAAKDADAPMLSNTVKVVLIWAAFVVVCFPYPAKWMSA